MLNPRADRALYRQLGDLLRADISGGVYAPGAVIPSESELMRRCGIARNTVRLAIAVLRHEGLVETRHGYGTFVRDPKSPDAPADSG